MMYMRYTAEDHNRKGGLMKKMRVTPSGEKKRRPPLCLNYAAPIKFNIPTPISIITIPHKPITANV